MSPPKPHKGRLSDLRAVPPWVGDCRGVLIDPGTARGSYEVRSEHGASWLLVGRVDEPDDFEIIRSLIDRCRWEGT